jgi:hypothetical protein
MAKHKMKGNLGQKSGRIEMQNHSSVVEHNSEGDNEK